MTTAQEATKLGGDAYNDPKGGVRVVPRELLIESTDLAYAWYVGWDMAADAAANAVLATETWEVVYRKQQFIRREAPSRSTWVTVETVLATGVSKSEADRIMAAHPDRCSVVAHPEVRV